MPCCVSEACSRYILTMCGCDGMKKEIVAVTNRKLCSGDFLQQLQRLANSGVAAVILREKDLSEEQYLQLAWQCRQALVPYGIPLVPNQHIAVSRTLQLKQIQLSFPLFAEAYNTLSEFERIWVSVHNMAEALQAEQWGAGAIIVGHIFVTDCKKDLAPQGLEFLQQICEAVSIPVYAIGGIHAQTYPLVLQSNATGVCVMSQSMTQEKFFWQTG